MTGDSLSEGVHGAGGFTEREDEREIRGGEETSATYGLYETHSCLMEGH